MGIGGSNAIHAVVAMELRDMKIEVGTQKQAEALTSSYIMMVVSYMSGAKSTIPGL